MLKGAPYAFNGWRVLLRDEPNISWLLLLALATTLLLFTGRVSVLELVILLFTVIFTLSLEIINTALEETLDLLVPEYNLKVKRAKDMASAAVLTGLITYVIFLFIFFFN